MARIIETADEISERAEIVLCQNGAQVTFHEEEQVTLVVFPEGSEQVGEDEFLLPDGHVIGVSGEDLGAFWEHAGPSKFYLKG